MNLGPDPSRTPRDPLVFSDHWLRGVLVAVVAILGLLIGFVVLAKLLVPNGGRPGVPTLSSFGTAVIGSIGVMSGLRQR